MCGQVMICPAEKRVFLRGAAIKEKYTGQE
jgi:hypothetical protein